MNTKDKQLLAFIAYAPAPDVIAWALAATDAQRDYASRLIETDIARMDCLEMDAYEEANTHIDCSDALALIDRIK